MSVRVLIADSSGTAREVVRHHLACMGCEVVAEADNALQAANLFKTVRPGVVMLSVGLKVGGDLDALALARMIREYAPETAIIVMGAAEHSPQFAPFVSEGAVEYLTHPLDARSFERVWRKLSTRFPELRPGERPGAGSTHRVGSNGR